ncbi:MAG: (2Fe-2S)-binding protein [Candidatus Aminicenantes bacterium]|nr:(2Fe-2S)-binding protein [Candidatus Aminicenantes bacterium]NLH76145.1 2Fe-2S iron-sulfur cluster binding domain-containing protein [Acidobacteriota bacterium]
MSDIHFTIDGKPCVARPGQTIVEAALANGVWIPVLCRFEGLKPAGSCRICTVRVAGRFMAACTQPVTEGMAVENEVADLEDMRKALVEMLFVEGNHFCPSCEKSGNCELQALGYRYRLTAPRFPYLWPGRAIDAGSPFLMLEHNRCIQCRRCVQAVKAKDGRKVFAAVERGGRVSIEVDGKLAAKLSEEEARKAMELCPVGAIIKKRTGFAVPIGKRKYDHAPIGSEAGKGAGR